MRFLGARQNNMDSVEPSIALFFREPLESLLDNPRKLFYNAGNLTVDFLFLRHPALPGPGAGALHAL